MINRRQVLQGICGAGFAAVMPTAFAAEERRKPIRVLSYNIWVGGEKGGIEQTAQVIRASQADLVGIQEAKASGPKLAELTGMSLFDQGGGVILSRFKIIEESPQKYGVKVDVPGRGPVWMFNAHLPASPYQPYQLAKIPYGKENPFIETAAEAISEAIRARSGPLSRLLMDLGHAIRTGDPILLTGDFNEPSHLDWTERAAKAGRCQIPVAWPTGRAICDAGFSDAYRTVFPNEITHPGLTWTPVPGTREVHDRIDLIYVRGLKPMTAQVIGESTKNADLVVHPYPSDHRAVVISVE